MTITPEQLAAWKALAEKATPPPWVASKNDPSEDAGEWSVDWINAPDYDWVKEVDPAVIVSDVRRKQDALFLVAAREAVPALIAECERLQSEIDFLREDFQKWQQSWQEAKKINEQYKEWLKAKSHNDALEWAAAWVMGSAENTPEYEKFAANMAMSIRAAKRDVPMPTAEVKP